jgi:putative oxidoreductase
MDSSSRVTLQNQAAQHEGATGDLPRESMTGVVWFDTLRSWLARFPLSIIQLAGRVGVGAVFFKAGLLKYNSWDFTVLLFRDEYKVPLLDPAVAARIAMVQELTIPIFLFLGLATRLATLPMLGMIIVIQTFVYPNAYNDHLVWGSILLLVLTRGPGVFSLDYLIERAIVARRSARGRSIGTNG